MKAKCPTCRRSPEVQAEFGCNAPAARAVLRITCTACNGPSQSCKVCSGRGFELIYRCPTSHVTPDVADAIAAYNMLESGILPVAGGWLDQSEDFAAACCILNAERSVIDRENQQRREAAARG